MWLTDTGQITISETKIGHFTFRGKNKGQSWVVKYCYPQKAGLPRCKNFTSEVFLCFGVIDFLLYFVWWLLFTFFMLLVRLVGFCTEDECKNRWLNCCVNCLNCKAQEKPLLSQYDLYVSKMTSLTGLEIISVGSPDTMTSQIHFNSVTYHFWLVKLCKINNS